MIAYLKGEIIDIELNNLVLLTNSGIGYSIGISDIIFAELNTKVGKEVELFTYHHISENQESLFGFLHKEEKQVFEELIKISGIGGRVALSILSLGINRLAEAVSIGDNKTIESIKGIGKKMAEKIILELKDKDFISSIALLSKSDDRKDKIQKISNTIGDSVKSTLVSMGYNPKEIDKVLHELPDGMQEVGDIMQYVIKKL